MPRKKTTTIHETLPDKDEQFDNPDVSDIIVVLSKVYRLNAGSKSFCFQSMEPVDEVYIQQQYPSGGKFIVEEYNTLSQLVNRQNIDIEPKPLPITSNGNGNGNDIQTRLLMDEIAWTRQMLMQMLTRGTSQQTPIGELVHAVQGMHAMGAGGKDPIELLIKGMELGAKAGGASPDWKSELIHTAKELLPQTLETINNLKQLSPQSNPMQLAAAIPQSVLLKQGISWMKSKILSGLEPELAVEWVIRNANDAQYQPFLAMAIQGNIDNFIELDSDIGNEPYRTWFMNAIQSLKDAYAEQSTNAVDMDGGNGDSPDVTPNANVSTRKLKAAKAM